MRTTDHIVLSGNHCLCLHCGERYPLHLPARVSMVQAIVDAFIKDHRHCQKREEK